jgi:large subunit ribosomal protein L9
MKVIIIKNCKDGNVNDVIDVSSGYATNFLIKNKFAIPFNKKTKLMLFKKLENIKNKENEKMKNAIKIKKVIENTNLQFSLKTTDLIVHGSITKKQILKELLKMGIQIDTHNIENVKIKTLGITKIKIKVYNDIIAKLSIEVIDGK